MHAVEAIELSKRFESVWAVKNITFSVGERAIAVLAGPNGAGKTTTVRMLTTVLSPSKGFARVMGFDVVKEFREVRKRIAYLPQDYGAMGDVTPYEFIAYTLMMRGFSYFVAKKEARRWIELLGLEQIAKRRSWVLSGGERRKMLVAATLASHADVVFLDEPTTGLDVESRYSILKVIRDASKELGSTILLTTHMLEEVQLIADHVVFINSGEVVAQGGPGALLSKLPYRYRVVLEGVDKGCLGNKHIDLGEKVITWVKSVEEAKHVAEVCKPSAYSTKDVFLEDVYLYIVGEKK
uniref:ABC transporter ATP-binding protein n=1 Tax=Ignisphaera aggregans TaxID=334771 RepID=A0A7J3Z7G7_9CREN